MPQARHGELVAALLAADLKGAVKAHDMVEEIIGGFVATLGGDSILAPAREEIDRCFGADSMEEIFECLGREDSDFARKTLEMLYAVSPTSLKVTLRQLRAGASLHFAKVMTMEYRISQAFMHTHDFFEGIRAALIDKDRQPKWRPAQLSGVDSAQVDAFFAAPAGDTDLVL